MEKLISVIKTFQELNNTIPTRNSRFIRMSYVMEKAGLLLDELDDVITTLMEPDERIGELEEGLQQAQDRIEELEVLSDNDKLEIERLQNELSGVEV